VKIVLHRLETQNMDFIFERKWHNCCACSQQFCFALKAQDAGADAIVAEGFEAGGHGREETTTLALDSYSERKNKIPLIAAGMQLVANVSRNDFRSRWSSGWK
jgi:hypothetical protein